MNEKLEKGKRFSFLEIFLLCVLSAVLCVFIFLGAGAPKTNDSSLYLERHAADAETIESEAEHSPSFEAGSRAMTVPKAAGINPAEGSTSAAEPQVSRDPQSGPSPDTARDVTNPPPAGPEAGAPAQAAPAPAGGAAGDTAAAPYGAEAQETTAAGNISADVEAELRAVAAMEWGPEAEARLKRVLVLWASSDPDAALSYALRIESRRAGTAAVNAVLTDWARRDPLAAFDWYMQNLSSLPGRPDNTIGELFVGMANASLESAMTSLNKLPTDSMRNKALRAIINEYVAKGDAGRLEMYFNSRGDTAALSLLAAAQIESIALYKPEAAAAWIATLTDRYVRLKAVNTLIDKWGYDNPVRAAQWVAGLPRDEYWSEFVERMTRIWAREFPDSAAAWLLSLSPPSEQLDAAIQTLVSIVLKANPAGAMAWADVITDPDRRQNLMQRAGYLWLQKDPAAATAYILNSSLPDAIKKRLLRKGRTPDNKP